MHGKYLPTLFAEAIWTFEFLDLVIRAQKINNWRKNIINLLKFTKALLRIKKFLIVKIHGIIKPIPDFAVRPKICPSVPMVSELDQLSEILQI